MRTLVFTFVVLCLLASQVWATCNPQENCSACIVKNPFTGGCTLRGNDLICETRKKACQEELLSCMAGLIGSAVFAPQCGGCLLFSGPAIATCAVPCGVSAATIQHTVKHCQ